MDMRFYWVQDRVRQGHFIVYWKPGAHNLADYFTKHFPASHHQLMRPQYQYVAAAAATACHARVCSSPPVLAGFPPWLALKIPPGFPP